MKQLADAGQELRVDRQQLEGQLADAREGAHATREQQQQKDADAREQAQAAGRCACSCASASSCCGCSPRRRAARDSSRTPVSSPTADRAQRAAPPPRRRAAP